MHPYQQALYDKIIAGGFVPGEMTIISSYRRTGKSMLNQMYGKLIATPDHCVVEKAMVDGEQWYTVEVRGTGILRWLREQEGAQDDWHHTKDISGIYNLVDIKETLYTLLVLRWGQ
jgi:hypothetical protein